MNNYLKIILVILIFSNTLFADITIAFAQNSTIYGNKPSPSQKIEILKIKKIAETNNIKVFFKAAPWKRALLLLKKGVVDGVINASFKKSRAEYSVYPTKNGMLDRDKRLNDGNTYYIYRHKDSLLRWNGKKFKNSGTIGVKANYAVIEDLKKHSNIKIEEFILNAEIIRKLSLKKLDGYAASYQEAKLLIEKYPQFSKNILKESEPIRKKDYFLVFSKKTYKEKSKEMEKVWLGFQKINAKK